MWCAWWMRGAAADAGPPSSQSGFRHGRLRATLRWAALGAGVALNGIVTSQRHLPQFAHALGLGVCVLLLRRIGRLPSWVSASGLTIADMACVVAFLVNTATIAVDVGLSLVVAAVLLPVVTSVARRRPSVPEHPRDDALGSMSRHSPPLLGAIVLAFAMYMLALTLGSHDASKLVGGLGIVLTGDPGRAGQTASSRGGAPTGTRSSSPSPSACGPPRSWCTASRRASRSCSPATGLVTSLPEGAHRQNSSSYRSGCSPRRARSSPGGCVAHGDPFRPTLLGSRPTFSSSMRRIWRCWAAAPSRSAASSRSESSWRHSVQASREAVVAERLAQRERQVRQAPGATAVVVLLLG